MRRRSFLKGLAALALAPAAALAKTDPPKPQLQTPLYDIKGPLGLKKCEELREARFDMMKRAMQRAHEEQKKKADAEAWDAISPEMQREKLKDLYISPEAMEDIRAWGVDQIDDKTHEELHELGRKGPYHRYLSFPVHLEHKNA
jgi:hypothetical protein